MRVLRSTLFWIHLLAGVAAGAIVLVMSATGVLLTYQRQLQHWADVRELVVTPPSGAKPLSADSLLAAVVGREGKAPSSVLWRVDPDAPVEVSFGREGRQYLDPYTGAVLGTGNATVRAFFTAVTDWHRWLAMEGEGRVTGRRVTGAANLAFLVLVMTGMYLWWPRTLRWTAFRPVLWFRRGLSAKARDFNWHHVIGLWSAIPLVVVVASGVVISYPWASRLVYRAVGEQPPAPAAGQGGGAASAPREAGSRGAADVGRDGVGRNGVGRGERAPVIAPRVGDVAALATARVPSWTSVSLAWPKGLEAPLVYTIDAGTGGQPQAKGTLTVARARDGRDSTSWAPFAAQSAGRRLRSWLRFLHTGEALGIAGQTVAGIVSLGAVLLVYTGLALSTRRLVAWRRRQAPAMAAVATRAPRTSR